MNTSDLLSAIDSEIATLKQVRALLAGEVHTYQTAKGPHKQHTMSAAGRAKIAAAQRKRWAERKSAAKKGA